MSDKLSERPDLLSHDSPHFDGEQYVYDAEEIKEAIDWADSLEASLSQLQEYIDLNEVAALEAKLSKMDGALHGISSSMYDRGEMQVMAAEALAGGEEA